MQPQYLSSGSINVTFSFSTIQTSIAMVQDTFEHDRSQPYVDYPCIAVIKNAHLKTYSSLRLMRKDKNGRLVKEECPVNAQAIPPTMIEAAVNSGYTFTHLVIDRRLFYDGKQELRIVLPPDQKQLGYYSNVTRLSKKGLAFLEGTTIRALQKKWLLKQYRTVRSRLHFFMQRTYFPPIFFKRTA